MAQQDTHHAVANIDAAATLPEREPVRVYGTLPTAILGTAGAIIALGVGSPQTALLYAAAIVVIGTILEIVRARVTPAGADPFRVPEGETP